MKKLNKVYYALKKYDKDFEIKFYFNKTFKSCSVYNKQFIMNISLQYFFDLKSEQELINKIKTIHEKIK